MKHFRPLHRIMSVVDRPVSNGSVRCAASVQQPCNRYEEGVRCAERLRKPSSNLSYDDAIVALNGLQSNAEAQRKAKQVSHSGENLEKVAKYLGRIGLLPSDLNRLNAIHVAGTKGKGSTCAFIEQILRDSGRKTGMFTSPHLISVNERIKINGRPISRARFADQFWTVYDLLRQKKENSDDMPSYFRMLTVLAFKTFLTEQVDVSIIEVGIGGQFDCTNILPSPQVCVITTLDYDHVKILGHTLEEIAWQKAGIMKPGVPCVVANGQQEEAMRVIQRRAAEIGSPLFVAPDLDSYVRHPEHLHLGLSGDVQKVNASLAVQATSVWVQRMKGCVGLEGSNFSPATSISDATSLSLQRCWLPGRAQVLKQNEVTFCVDGAHTGASMRACATWFTGVLRAAEAENRNFSRVLIFNCTGDRDSAELLMPLTAIEWNAVFFCPNQAYCRDTIADQKNCRVNETEVRKSNERQRAAWLDITKSGGEDPSGDGKQVSVVHCISEAFEKARKTAPYLGEVFVLVTGSMHLVGGALSVIDPNLSPAD